MRSRPPEGHAAHGRSSTAPPEVGRDRCTRARRAPLPWPVSPPPPQHSAGWRPGPGPDPPGQSLERFVALPPCPARRVGRPLPAARMIVRERRFEPPPAPRFDRIRGPAAERTTRRSKGVRLTGIWYVIGFAFAGVSFVFLTIGAAWLVRTEPGRRAQGPALRVGIDTYGDTHGASACPSTSTPCCSSPSTSRWSSSTCGRSRSIRAAARGALSAC